MEEQCPLHILEEKQVQVGTAAVVKVVDGAVVLPEVEPLVGIPERGDHTLPEAPGAVSSQKSRQAGGSQKQQERVEIDSDARNEIAEQNAVIGDRREQP
jgi:hypothetical protein